MTALMLLGLSLAILFCLYKISVFPYRVTEIVHIALLVALLPAAMVAIEVLYLGPVHGEPLASLPSWLKPFAAFGAYLPVVERCIEYFSQFGGIPPERLDARAAVYGTSFLLGFFAVLTLLAVSREASASRCHAAALRINNVKKKKYDLGDMIVWQGTGALLVAGLMYFFVVGNVMGDLSESDRINMCIWADRPHHHFRWGIFIGPLGALFSGYAFGYLFSLPFVWAHLKRHHCVGWRFVGAETVEPTGPKSARFVGRVLIVLLAVAGIAAYAGWLVSYTQMENYPNPDPLVIAVNNAVFFPEDRRPEGRSGMMRMIRQARWCEESEKWETRYPTQFRTADCSVVRPADGRFGCSFWWLGRQCLYVDIFESTYEIPEVRKAVRDALRYPCKYVSRASYTNDAPLFGTADFLNCSTYSWHNASDVYLRILDDGSGALLTTEYFPTRSRRSTVNRLYALFGGT